MCAIPYGVVAQTNPTDSKPIYQRQNFMIHYSLAQHMNAINPSSRIGFEKTLTQYFSANAEVGYIYKGVDRNFDFIDGTNRGFHVGIGPKLYPYVGSNKARGSTYLMWDVSFDKVFQNRTDFIPREGGAYLQKMAFRSMQMSFTQMIKYGKTLIHSEPVNLNVSVGIGMRSFRVSYKDLPRDVNHNDIGSNINDGNGRSQRPAFQVGIFLTFPGTADNSIEAMN